MFLIISVFRCQLGGLAPSRGFEGFGQMTLLGKSGKGCRPPITPDKRAWFRESDTARPVAFTPICPAHFHRAENAHL